MDSITKRPTYVRRDDLRIQGLSGIFRTKQLPSDGTAGTITAQNVVGLVPLHACRRLNLHPGLLFILSDLHNLVSPVQLAGRLTLDVLAEQLAQLVQGEDDHAVPIVRRKDLMRHAGDESRVDLSPAHAFYVESLGDDIVEDSRAVELVGGGGCIVRRAWLPVEFGACVEDFDLNPLLAQEEGEDES